MFYQHSTPICLIPPQSAAHLPAPLLLVPNAQDNQDLPILLALLASLFCWSVERVLCNPLFLVSDLGFVPFYSTQILSSTFIIISIVLLPQGAISSSYLEVSIYIFKEHRLNP